LLHKTKDGGFMVLKIDFNSDEAIYIQLRNQIIMGIATDMIREGDTLPSVRQMADYIGINMHTVNKAYSVLKQEGFVKLDRRKGAVVSLDIDKIQSMGELRRNLDVVLAWGICKNITRNEVHQVVDEIYDKYTRGCMDTEEDEADEN
jgi:GntR family transcriptional regulator